MLAWGSPHPHHFNLKKADFRQFVGLFISLAQLLTADQHFVIRLLPIQIAEDLGDLKTVFLCSRKKSFLNDSYTFGIRCRYSTP